MTFNEYQFLSRETAIYPNLGKNVVYPTLGLAGESGEVAEKVKKVIRDKDGEFDAIARLSVRAELGDVLWYVAAIASELGISLDDVASSNIAKLTSRHSRGVISGSGDER